MTRLASFPDDLPDLSDDQRAAMNDRFLSKLARRLGWNGFEQRAKAAAQEAATKETP